MKSKVYFTSNISSEGVLKLYKTLNYELKGNVCIKVHSGIASSKSGPSSSIKSTL